MPCDQHSLIADVALLAEGEVLLVRYKDVNKYDHQKGWFLPTEQKFRFWESEGRLRSGVAAPRSGGQFSGDA